MNDLLSGLFLLNVQRSIDVGRTVHVDVVGREGLDNRGKLIFRLFHIFPQKNVHLQFFAKKTLNIKLVRIYICLVSSD